MLGVEPGAVIAPFRAQVHEPSTTPCVLNTEGPDLDVYKAPRERDSAGPKLIDRKEKSARAQRASASEQEPKAPTPQVTRDGAFSAPQIPKYGAGAGSARWEQDGKVHFIPASVVGQIDGLMKSLLGLRVERDVCAKVKEEACCVEFGCPQWESWSAFTGIYCPGGRDADLSRMVSKAELEHACGVFVVPHLQFKTWYKTLEAKRLLTLHIPVYEVRTDLTGLPLVVSHAQRFVAVVASFEWFGKLKSKRRKECVFRLEAIQGLEARGAKKVPAIPYLTGRTSPLATDMISEESDTLKCSGKFMVVKGTIPPPTAPPFWVHGALANAAKGFPFPEVLAIAVKSTSEGINPFRGKLEKSITQPPCRFESEETSTAARAQFMADVAATYTAGPYQSLPFEWARLCQWFTVPKDKYNAADKRVRLVSNYSHGGSGSTNELCYTPKMIGVHHSAGTIKTRIAMCGKDAKVRAWDIPKCFKRQRLPIEIVHLFCYLVSTEEHGEEYFVDRSNPFGWTPAEWAWQCILAVVMWIMGSRALDDLFAFVDNFFDIQPKFENIKRNERIIESTFAELGLVVHEKQGVSPEGVEIPQFKGLGWEFDTHRMVMVLPENKWKRFCAMLGEWRRTDIMSVEAIRKAVGYMLCFSCGFQIGRPLVAFMVHARTEGERQMKISGLTPTETTVKLNPNAAMAMQFWDQVFSSWDRTCPIVAEFTPQSGCQVLLRSDASTDWGWGGMVWLSPFQPLANEAQVIHGAKGQWSDVERAQAIALIPALGGAIEATNAAVSGATKLLLRESTAVFEAKAVLKMLQKFVHVCAGKRVQIEIDNATVVRALEAMYSPTPSVMAAVLEIGVFCCKNNMTVRTRWIMGKLFNQVADRLSHDCVSQAETECRAMFGKKLVLQQ